MFAPAAQDTEVIADDGVYQDIGLEAANYFDWTCRGIPLTEIGVEFKILAVARECMVVVRNITVVAALILEVATVHRCGQYWNYLETRNWSRYTYCFFGIIKAVVVL